MLASQIAKPFPLEYNTLNRPMKSRTISRARTSLLLLMINLLLAGCALPRSAQQSAQAQNAQATQAAFLVQTELARPTGTPSPLPTLSPTQTVVPPSATPLVSATPPIRVTPLPGLALYSHPGITDYVFQIDPAQWTPDPGGQTADLVHQTIADCRIEAVPGRGLGPPERLFWQDLGRFRWEILDYGTWAYVRPVVGADLVNNQNNFLALQDYHRAACRGDQETVLANLMTLSEAEGRVAYARYVSPTPRPAMEGFECPDTPPARLRVGDEVAIITDGLWLRSEPRVDNSTKVLQFRRNPPYRVRVIGGPVCETYVYWQVEVGAFGEGSETLQGWLAEGDPQEYYLVPVR